MVAGWVVGWVMWWGGVVGGWYGEVQVVEWVMVGGGGVVVVGWR